MRIAMFGYQTWGHRTLRALLDSGHEVCLVVTHPRSDHVYEKVWDDSVADLAVEHGVPVVLANRPDAELVTTLGELAPDLIVANNWRTWIPPEIFDLPRHGTLNVHDSLLPGYAGFSPIIWRSSTASPRWASPRTGWTPPWTPVTSCSSAPCRWAPPTPPPTSSTPRWT